jgi:hypothetical protein
MPISKGSGSGSGSGSFDNYSAIDISKILKN